MTKRKIIVWLSSIAVILIASEIIIRNSSLETKIDLNAGYIRLLHNDRMVYDFLPNPDFKPEKPANAVRIAVLGDAIVRGVFVPQQENFCNKLQALLNERAKKDAVAVVYEVMNFGVPGYNLEAEVELLKEKALAYKPDVVILNMYYNDNEPMPGIDFFFIGNYLNLGDEEQAYIAERYMYNKGSIFRKFERSVLYRSKLYRLVVYRLAYLNRHSRLSKIRSRYGLDFKDMAPIHRGMGEIERLRRQYGFKVLICIHPSLLFADNPNDLRFGMIADKSGMDYFYMSSYYQKEKISAKSLQISDRPDDFSHPNALGHTLIAKAMFEELNKRKLFPD